MERLQKVIANNGYCSRRRAEELIRRGEVMVNGMVVTELGVKVGSHDSICVEGVSLDKNKAYEYYLLYKPRGVVSTVCDDKGRKTVVDLIPTNTRIYPVGRLDYDTTGVLLLTNDGKLANLLMHPKSGIDKVYFAKVKGILTGSDIKKIRNGIVVDGVVYRKCFAKVRSIDKGKDTCIVEIVIREGKNHQVKKMIEGVGKKVIKLKRERYADLDLTGLKVGEYRRLSVKEVKILYSKVSN